MTVTLGVNMALRLITPFFLSTLFELYPLLNKINEFSHRAWHWAVVVSLQKNASTYA